VAVTAAQAHELLNQQVNTLVGTDQAERQEHRCPDGNTGAAETSNYTDYKRKSSSRPYSSASGFGLQRVQNRRSSGNGHVGFTSTSRAAAEPGDASDS
jgi:hypothetical protein